MKKTLATELIAFLLVFLFSYTAVAKLISVKIFQGSLERLPLIGTGAGLLAYALPLAELCIALLLLFTITRLKGFWLSFILLSVFTIYLATMLVFMPHLPCSCGGIISGLGWKEHLFLNTFLVGLCFVAIRIQKTNKAVYQKNSFPGTAHAAPGR